MAYIKTPRKTADQPTKKQIESRGRGGARINAGRPRVWGGIRHHWTVPPDIHDLQQRYGTDFLWQIIHEYIDQQKAKGVNL